MLLRLELEALSLLRLELEALSLLRLELEVLLLLRPELEAQVDLQIRQKIIQYFGYQKMKQLEYPLFHSFLELCKFLDLGKLSQVYQYLL